LSEIQPMSLSIGRDRISEIYVIEKERRRISIEAGEIVERIEHNQNLFRRVTRSSKINGMENSDENKNGNKDKSRSKSKNKNVSKNENKNRSKSKSKNGNKNESKNESKDESKSKV
jgi:hypothetical protein